MQEDIRSTNRAVAQQAIPFVKAFAGKIFQAASRDSSNVDFDKLELGLKERVLDALEFKRSGDQDSLSESGLTAEALNELLLETPTFANQLKMAATQASAELTEEMVSAFVKQSVSPSRRKLAPLENQFQGGLMDAFEEAKAPSRPEVLEAFSHYEEWIHRFADRFAKRMHDKIVAYGNATPPIEVTPIKLHAFLRADLEYRMLKRIFHDLGIEDPEVKSLKRSVKVEKKSEFKDENHEFAKNLMGAFKDRLKQDNPKVMGRLVAKALAVRVADTFLKIAESEDASREDFLSAAG